jgi:integrase
MGFSEGDLRHRAISEVGHLWTCRDCFDPNSIPFPSPGDLAGTGPVCHRCVTAHTLNMRPNTVHVAFDRSHTSPWEVYCYREGRKVRLGRRKTKKEAEALCTKYQDEFNQRGSASPILTTAQADEYLRAKKALGDVSLDIVVAGYLSSVEKPSIGLEAAAIGFMADLEQRGLAKVSIRDYRGKLDRLVEDFKGATVESFATPPSGVDPHPLLKFILAASENQQTRVHYRTKIGTFLRWCETRNLLSVHPNRWVKLGRVCRNTPEVYTPAEMEAILRLFQKRCPRLIPYLALNAFAALRPSEASRQTIRRILFDEKRLLVSHKKKGADAYEIRPIDAAPPILWEWLTPQTFKRDVLVIDSRDFYQQKEIVFRGTGVEWIPDGFRSSCLTYYAKIYGHDKAAELAGHKAGSYTLSTHYRNVHVTTADSEAYLGIRP